MKMRCGDRVFEPFIPVGSSPSEFSRFSCFFSCLYSTLPLMEEPFFTSIHSKSSNFLLLICLIADYLNFWTGTSLISLPFVLHKKLHLIFAVYDLLFGLDRWTFSLITIYFGVSECEWPNALFLKIFHISGLQSFDI